MSSSVSISRTARLWLVIPGTSDVDARNVFSAACKVISPTSFLGVHACTVRGCRTLAILAQRSGKQIAIKSAIHGMEKELGYTYRGISFRSLSDQEFLTIKFIVRRGDFSLAGKRARPPTMSNMIDPGDISIAPPPPPTDEELNQEVIKEVAETFVNNIMKTVINELEWNDIQAIDFSGAVDDWIC